MRGLTISAHGGLDRLELRDDLAVPALVSDTQVRVRILAAALNHLDLFVIGGLPNVRIVPPWIIGSFVRLEAFCEEMERLKKHVLDLMRKWPKTPGVCFGLYNASSTLATA